MHMNQLSFSSIHWLNTSPCLSSLVLSTRWGSMPPMSRQTLPLKMGPLHSRETATSRMKLNSNFTDLIQVRMVSTLLSWSNIDALWPKTRMAVKKSLCYINLLTIPGLIQNGTVCWNAHLTMRSQKWPLPAYHGIFHQGTLRVPYQIEWLAWLLHSVLLIS